MLVTGIDFHEWWIDMLWHWGHESMRSFCGGLNLPQHDRRMTPYMKPHSTELAGNHDNRSAWYKNAL
jgi:hypothetical protein